MDSIERWKANMSFTDEAVAKAKFANVGALAKATAYASLVKLLKDNGFETTQKTISKAAEGLKPVSSNGEVPLDWQSPKTIGALKLLSENICSCPVLTSLVLNYENDQQLNSTVFGSIWKAEALIRSTSDRKRLDEMIQNFHYCMRRGDIPPADKCTVTSIRGKSAKTDPGIGHILSGRMMLRSWCYEHFAVGSAVKSCFQNLKTYDAAFGECAGQEDNAAMAKERR